MKKVVLVGYMGCGKSNIANLLQKKMQIPSFDLDDIIENQSGMTIEKIFSEKGEIYFRKLEHKLFLEKMMSDECFILSTGGGTPCYSENHLLLKSENCNSIFLKTSVDELYQRLHREMKKRPLISNLNKEELKDFIAKHLFDRNYYYNQAKYSVLTDNKSLEEIADEVIKLLA